MAGAHLAHRIAVASRSRVDDERTRGDGDAVARATRRSTATSCCRSTRRDSTRRRRGSSGTTTAARRDRRGVRARRSTRRSAPADVIFLVDRSGSMDGTSIEEVRNALQLCLRSMIAGLPLQHRRLRLAASRRCFRRVARYDEASLAEASAHVARAGGGSRRHRDPAGAAVRARAAAAAGAAAAGRRADRRRGDQHGRRARARASSTRRTRASSRSASAPARAITSCKGLARAGGGTAEFIFPGRAHRTEGRAPVRPAALAGADERAHRLGRLDVHAGHVVAAAGLRRRPAARLRAGRAAAAA